MSIRAFLFDLGGTLVKNLTWGDYRKAANAAAVTVGAPPEAFVKLWFEKAGGARDRRSYVSVFDKTDMLGIRNGD